MSVLYLDTDCEIPVHEYNKLTVETISMPYTIDGEQVYPDPTKDFDYKDFFGRVRKGSMPTTMALNPQDYIDLFEPALKANEDILYVHFSHKMSGTFDYMNQAIEELKKKYPERKITTVDTLSISGGAGLTAMLAAQMHKRGASDDEIVKFVEKFRQESNCYFVVDNLMHLFRGGRLSKTSAVIGSMINLKPLIAVDSDGKLEACAKIMGRKKSLLALVDKVKQYGTNLADYPLYVLHADCEEDGQFVFDKLKELFPEVNIEIAPIGPVIGAHCGPGTVGVIFHANKRNM